MPNEETFQAILNAAINDIAENGFDTAERIAYWQRRLREAAEQLLTPGQKMERMLRDALTAVYRRLIERGGILEYHPGIELYTIDKVKPQLRAELSKRIVASADLIKLNRHEEIEKTLRRFSGWASSIPAGGSDQVKKPKVKKEIRKSFAGLPFTERRVLIDQGHKLEASVSEIVATGGGAIAGIWKSHYNQANYDYREEHKERAVESAKKPYLVRDSWAHKAGFVKLAGSKYIDEMTKPGEEVFCRCFYKWIYTLRGLPEEMITAKGKAALEMARKAMG